MRSATTTPTAPRAHCASTSGLSSARSPGSANNTPTTSRSPSQMATIDITSAPVDPDVADLYEHYRTMFLIRRFEEAAERQYKAARIGGYCHLSSGQEATTV